MKKTLSPESYLKDLEKQKAKVTDSALAEIQTAYQKDLSEKSLTSEMTKPTYGSLAERLGGAGLSMSGYRDYLEKESRAAKDSAATESFGNYLSRYQKAAEEGKNAESEALSAATKQSATVLKTLISYGTVNYDTAYKYALSQGLSETVAKEVSDLAISENESNFISETLKKAIKNHDAKTTTLAYAYAKGLSDAGLEKINEFYNKYTKDTTTLSEVKEIYERLAKQ